MGSMILDSVSQILEDKPDLSRWSLKYKAFGRDIEFSWLARNMQVSLMAKPFPSCHFFVLLLSLMPVSDIPFLVNYFQPIPNQKIHWRSLDGLPNRYKHGSIDKPRCPFAKYKRLFLFPFIFLLWIVCGSE